MAKSLPRKRKSHMQKLRRKRNRRNRRKLRPQPKGEETAKAPQNEKAPKLSLLGR